MEIQEGNKLIAEFMGGKVEKFTWRKYDPIGVVFDTQEHGLYSHVLCDLQYHSSWDWLHPVIKKIETHVLYRNCKSVEEFSGMINHWRPIAAAMEKIEDIENVWPYVVQFIQWHNQFITDKTKAE